MQTGKIKEKIIPHVKVFFLKKRIGAKENRITKKPERWNPKIDPTCMERSLNPMEWPNKFHGKPEKR